MTVFVRESLLKLFGCAILGVGQSMFRKKTHGSLGAPCVKIFFGGRGCEK